MKPISIRLTAHCIGHLFRYLKKCCTDHPLRYIKRKRDEAGPGIKVDWSGLEEFLHLYFGKTKAGHIIGGNSKCGKKLCPVMWGS